ncbi:MAG: IS66 family transposase [Thermomicrobiales bacterium]
MGFRLLVMEMLTRSHHELVELVAQQQAIIADLRAMIARLEQRIRDLEGGVAPSRRMPGHKPGTPAVKGDRPPRAKRTLNLARRRVTPTGQVTHALSVCPDCGAPLAGGSIKRRREVLEIAPQPMIVTEHVYLERCCGDCGRRVTPTVDLDGVVVGQSRLGIGALSLIALLREELRLPLASIQRYLRSLHGFRLSLGGIVGALGQVARAGQPEQARILAAIRASPVVHADETGWREDGVNRFAWTFSTPTASVYTHGGRGKAMVDATLVSDFYAAYDHYPGVQRKCWAHLWRDLRELERQHPNDAALAGWVNDVAAIDRDATGFSHPDERTRMAQRRALAERLLAVGQPFLTDETAPQAVLCRRMEKYLESLFTFVVDPAVPPANNAAERSLRHLVVSRKISGGTRSKAGTQTKLTLASLFTTWRLRGLDPFVTCRQMLTSPEV